MQILLSSPQITRGEDSIFVDKPDGTKVNYYLYPEFEIHANEIPAGTIQGWHHHELIDESMLITSGSLVIRWKDGDKILEKELVNGDLVRFGSSVHTLENRSNKPALATVFRYVPDGKDKRELIKSDRHTDEVRK